MNWEPRILFTKMFPASLHHIHRQEHFCKYVLASRMGVIMEKPPNMAPTWLPKRSQNGLKIDGKIDQNYDGFGDRFLKDFNWFWAPKWSQVGTNIDPKTIKKRWKSKTATKQVTEVPRINVCRPFWPENEPKEAQHGPNLVPQNGVKMV